MDRRRQERWVVPALLVEQPRAHSGVMEARKPSMGARRVTSVVELKGVSKIFGEKRALSGIDFRVEAGEGVALLVPNGAGKTTAIAIMLGLREASSGEVRLFGR